MDKVTQVKNESNIIKILKGVGISFLVTLIILIIFSLILTYTNVSESTIPAVIIVITAISIFIGSEIISSKIGKNGVLNGGIIGGMYIFLIYIISSILNTNFTLNMESIIMIIIGIVFGIIGGIVGVNRK